MNSIIFDAHSALWVTKNPYAAISSGARNKENISINRSISRVGKRDSNKKNYSHNDIERIVKELHARLWKNRHDYVADKDVIDPVQLLDPKIILEHLGFRYEEHEFLGEYTKYKKGRDIAGFIDRNSRSVQISSKLESYVQRFTAAHELGHAMLHKEIRLHRDGPVDGSLRETGPREIQECEADIFAALFLMPKNLVISRFEQNFGMSPFVLDDNTAFGLAGINADQLITGIKTTRDLARILAKANQFHTRKLESLASQFKVSIEAMAIRLEELGLVEI